ILAIIVLLFASCLYAQTQNYQVNPQLCSLTFDVSAQAHNVHGTSREFSGTISGDPKDIKSAKIDIKLDPKTFDTNNTKRDKVMREKSLEVDKYPAVEFISNTVEASVKELVPNHPLDARVKGVLSLHGIKTEMTVP